MLFRSYLKGELPTKKIQTLIIDEADRMMDMNFMPQLRKIFEVIPHKRQNLLFSATFSERVEKLSSEFLDFPLKIEVTPQATVARQVSQFQIAVPNFKTKINLLVHLLHDPEFSRVILFTRTRQAADDISKYIDRIDAGPVRAIHSNKGQNARINAIREFADGDLRIIVATDVASRGIDIEKVTHVINFDVPIIYDDYVHRIGRTGRAAEKGISITMVTPADGPSFGMAPAGTCTCRSWVSKYAGSRPRATEEARMWLTAARADSCITLPSWPVRIRLL